MEQEKDLPDWLIKDIQAQAARMDDGRLIRDLGEIGDALCDADAEQLRHVLADPRATQRIQEDLEVILPFYLQLLTESINRHGEESHLSMDDLTKLLESHGKAGIVLKPKLLLESGRFGFALMQAAAALADLDDTLAGPWYLSLKELLQQEGIASV